MKRVLVTGAGGFIGRHCLPSLSDRGFEVHAVGGKSEARGADAVWHTLDLLDGKATSELLAAVQPSHLLHLAWYMEHGKLYGAEENYDWVLSSFHLLREFARRGGTRAVLAGTCYEYDSSYGFFRERETPLAPSTVYGAAKRALFNLFDSFTAVGPLSGAWGRIFFAYGPGEHPQRLVASVIRSILAGQPARCSHGRQVRDFLYVRDVADALVAMLESDLVGPVNIASGHPTTLRDLIHTAARKLDAEHLVELGAFASSPDEPPVLLADARRLTEELNWRPGYDLDRGLQETIDWWKAGGDRRDG